MIPDKLRLSLIIALGCYFALILIFLKRRDISLKYTLLWIISGTFMGVLVIWPEALIRITSMIGIESNMNGLFIMAIAFVIVILMSITSIVSRQAEKIKTLIQAIAMLEKRVRELEEEKAGEKN